MQRHQLNIRISKELKDEFYLYCQKENVQPSTLIRSWIEEVIETDKVESNDYHSKFFLPRNII